MLRTRVVAPGEMDVHGQIEGDAALTPVRDLFSVPFRVGGGEFAADIARAGNKAGTDRGGADGQADCFDPRLHRRDVLRAHAGDDQILPNSEADVAVAEIAGNLREFSHLIGSHLADREDHTDPIAIGLLLCVDAEMSRAIEGRSRRERIAGYALKLATQFVLNQRQHLVEADAVDDVFEARLGAVGPVTLIDEHAYDGVGYLGRVRGLDHHAGFAREVSVPGDAADQEAEPYPCRDLVARSHLDCLEADVVGVFEHGNDAAAVKADVELSRQTVERALVENVEMPLSRVWPGIDQLLRIDASGGRPCDVANIVGA